MAYLEFLRVRRIFLRFALIAAIVAGFIIFGAAIGAHANVDVNDSGPGGTTHAHMHGFGSLGIVPVPLEALIGIAVFYAIGIATALGTTFNRETQLAHFTFVRPLSRVRMALIMGAVDLGGILVGGVFSVLLSMLTVLASLQAHAHFVATSQTLGYAVLGIGTVVMWYAILQAVSSWSTNRPGAYVAITVVLMFVTIPLSRTEFFGPLEAVFRALLYIDPVAYFTNVTITDANNVQIGSALTSSLGFRMASVWVLGAAFLALSIYDWKRVEI